MSLPDDCQQICKHCKFYEAIEEEGGVCHRMPPTLFLDEGEPNSVFAIVDEGDWCGEFKRAGCH